MQFIGDAAWWDGRFAARQAPLPPDGALVRDIGRLKKGSVLDIACGDGRNALYLAQNGFRVTGVDFSQNGLSRLNAFASERGLTVETRRMDLTLLESFSELTNFDSLIINHYRVAAHIASVLPGQVTAGGTIWINGFYGLPQINPRITEQELLRRDDFAGMESDCRLIFQEEYETELGSFMTLLYQKR